MMGLFRQTSVNPRQALMRWTKARRRTAVTVPRCRYSRSFSTKYIRSHFTRLPIESVRAVQQDFIFARRTAGFLAGTDQHIDQRCPGNTIRVADNHRRVRPRVGKIAGPNLPLFHSASTFKVEARAVRRSA